jgi:hypothetical protein
MASNWTPGPDHMAEPVNTPSLDMVTAVKEIAATLDPLDSLERRIRRAMRRARTPRYQITLTEAQRFQAAVGAVMSMTEPLSEERALLVDSLRMVVRQTQAIAVLTGKSAPDAVQRVAEAMERDFPDPDAVLSLQLWWREESIERRHAERRIADRRHG